MTNFSNAFKNEIIKINSNHTILKVCIAILVFFIIVTFSYNLINETMGDYLGSMGNISEEDINLQISLLKSQIDNYDESDGLIGIADNTLYSLKAKLSLLEYVRDNNINLGNMSLMGSMSFDSAGFISTIMELSGTIIMVFAVVMAIRTFHSEKRNGTLKMQMMRPVTRKSFLFTKMLSIWVVSVAMYFVFTVLAEIVAIIKFGASTKDILYVFNATSVGTMSFVSYLFMTFFTDIFKIWCYMQLAYFISSLLWRRESCTGIIIALVLLGGTLDSLLNYIYIGYVGFFNNMEFMSALSAVSAPPMKAANLYSMLGITIVYQVLMTTYTYLHFDRCDIA